MDDWTFCLGIQAFGLCRYDPLRPHAVYFSIGEAIGALAFLLAFTQLVTPALRFRLRVRARRAWLAFATFIAAFICVVVAALIPATQGRVHPIVSFPIAWEVAGGALVLGGALLLVYSYFRRVTFTPLICEPYFQACYDVILRGEDSGLRALADEIRYSADAIVAAARTRPEDGSPRTNELIAPTLLWEHAFRLLDLFSDERFCRIIVNHAPLTATTYIDSLSIRESKGTPGYAFVRQLIRQTFLSNDSPLERERDPSGLGHFQQYTRRIFGNYRFVSGAYVPFLAWGGFDPAFLSNQGTAKLGRALAIAFEGYFSHGQFQERPTMLGYALDQLVNVGQSNFARLANGQPTSVGFFSSARVEAIAFINLTMNDLVRIVVKHGDELPAYPFDALTYTSQKDLSIFGVLAQAAVNYFANLSTYLRTDDESLYVLADALWLTIVPKGADATSPSLVQIQRRMFALLATRFDDALAKGSNQELVRLFLLMFDFQDRSYAGATTRQFAQTVLRKKLRERFAAAYAADPEKAARMLPMGVTFDATAGELVAVNKYTKGVTRFSLQRPMTSPDVI